MCGINGFSWDDDSLIRKMNKILAYRGPDDTGIYSEKDMSLGHNRLSIIDLSDAGHQPMCNEDRTVWLVFNGEIYNHREIRPILKKKGHKFQSHTDSEVIIHSYEEYGTGCLERFNGMFAFALWDSKKKMLFLARDRIGVKPLYYHFDGKNIIFSSEIKAILRHEIVREISKDALNSFLTYRFIPGPSTILQGIRKLLPAHYLIFRDGRISLKRYWSLSWKPDYKSQKELETEVENLLSDSVRMRLESDVPLGAYLSGGLDSSLIVALNAKLRKDSIKTFTVGFGHESDEFAHAHKVAHYIGTEHREVIVDYNEMTRELPHIVWLMDEPSSDITMMPMYFLSKFSKRYVTVVNTGEGADETFSGYHHYKIGAESFRFVPDSIRKGIYRWYYSPFKSKERKRMLGFKAAEDRALASQLSKHGDLLSNILHFEIENELPNWQLARVDRMTMANAIEARVPFLDYRLVELSAKIPSCMKQRGLSGKHILKKIASKYLPKSIVQRKKQGFTTPREEWIRRDLHDLAEQMLSRENITSRGLFKQEYVASLIDNAKTMRKDLPFRPVSYKILMLVMLETWFRTYLDHDGAKPVRFQ